MQVGTATDWREVSAGKTHSFGIKDNGTLWAWGDNQNATLGDGTFVNKSVPTQIGTATNWKMISNNQSRSIAIKEDGTLWVWGLNASLGTGAGSSTSHITVPTQVGIDTNWKVATAGFGFFLALKTDHTLWAWGGGDNGQLGNGGINGTHIPTQIGTDTNWQSIDADLNSSFAIKSDGTLWAWGYNFYGTLGNGTQANLLVPTQIGTATDWETISTGTATTSALKADGSLYSWGYNAFGGIGDGTYVDKLSPELVTTCTLDTDDFNTKKVNLYPNPVQNQLFINSEETQYYQIYSILGTTLSEGTLSVGSSIDCSALSSGVYLLSLRDGFGKVNTVKFVKE
ncbi:MAG: T9SS type A sorting domain-containing protein [Flavobacterium sp.]|nr:MAG: T9SS type A sorting domain-containing protein [Flavobacterium sp.]